MSRPVQHGLLGSLMAFDFAKAVIDNKIALMLNRLKRGVEFSEENLCLDLIAQVGPGGTYMDTDHTMENMRTTAVLPKVAVRDMRTRWNEEGRPDAHTRAMNEARRILAGENPARFPAELDARIRSHFAGLVGAMPAGRNSIKEKLYF